MKSKDTSKKEAKNDDLSNDDQVSFKSFIEESEADIGGDMPCYHTNEGIDFIKILRDPTLKPSHCNIFERDILYFFWGKPSYRPNSNSKATSIKAFFPVCYILSPEAINRCTSIYPFDTGAQKKGLYLPHLHPKMDVTDFELPPDPSIPSKIISKFYLNEKGYFQGIAKQGLNIPPLDFWAESYYKLIQDGGNTDVDDRRGTIELHIAHELQLSASNLKAIILPAPFLDDRRVTDFISEMKCEALPYQVFHGRISEFHGQIYTLASQFMGLNDD